MKFFSFCLLTLATSFALAAAPTPATDAVTTFAQIKERGDKHQVLFNFSRTITHQGDNTVVECTTFYPGAEKKKALWEKTTYKNSRSIKFEMEQYQLDANGSFVVDGDKVNFSYTHDGKEKTSSEKYVENFVATDELVSFMIKNLKTLMDGKTISVRVPVVDRLETVGFKIYMDREEPGAHSSKNAVMKMSANFPTSLFVPNFYFYLSEGKTPDLVKVEGLVGPRIKNNNTWEPLRAILEVVDSL